MRKATLSAYATGSVAIGVVDSLPTVILLFYATELLGLAASAAGMTIFLVRCAGFLTDPVVGALCDRESMRRGSPRRLLLSGYAALAAGYLSLFTLAPLTGPLYAYVVLVAGLGLVTVGSSCIGIPHLAMAAAPDIPATINQKLIAARSTAFMTGLLVGGSLAPLFIEYLGADIAAYKTNAAAVSILVMLSAIPVYAVARNWPKTRASTAQMTFRGYQAYRLPILKSLLAANILQVFALAACFTALPYIVEGTQSQPSLGYMTATAVLAAAVSIPIWERVANRTSLAKGFAFGGMSFACGTVVLWLSVTAASQVPSFLAMMFCGTGLGAIQFCAYALLSTNLQSLGSAHDLSQGSAIGFWVAAERATLALGPLAIGICLDFIGSPATLAPAAAFVVASVIALSLWPLIKIDGGLSRPRTEQCLAGDA